MSNQYDPIPAAERRKDLEDQRAADGYAATHKRLMSDMLDALLTEPRRIVSTPAYNGPNRKPRLSAAYEAMSELTEENAVRVCELLAACDRADWRAANILAKALLSTISAQYADMHTDAECPQ